MSALAGLLMRDPSDPTAAWGLAVEQMASRDSGPLAQRCFDTTWTAARGSGAHCLYVGDDVLVQIDGSIDNLESVARGAGLATRKPPGAQVAAVIRELGDEGLARLEGAFSLAVVDLANRSVTLVSDRFGTRPLVYALLPDGWAWASELKILAPLLPARKLSADGVAEAFQTRYLLGDRTLLAGVSQVLPGCRVVLGNEQPPRVTNYWSLRFAPSTSGDGLQHWEARIDAALERHFELVARRYRRVACLLSGGVDSSLLLAKASRAGFEKCFAVTCRFPGDPNPELENAEKVARHLGVRHLVLDVDDAFVRESFPRVIWRMEEPPRHYHSLALLRIYEHLAGQVDAVVDGNAADSLFGSSSMLTTVKQARFDRIPDGVKRLLARTLVPLAGRRGAALEYYLGNNVESSILSADRVRHSRSVADLVPGIEAGTAPNPRLVELALSADSPAAERYQRFTVYSHNRSHIVKNDRLSASTGLDVLNPFLSPPVLDVASTFPTRFKVSNPTKRALKDLASRSIPREMVDAPKQGFPVPMRRWLKEPLAPWRNLLVDERSHKRGLFRMEVVRDLDPERDYQLLWTSLCLEIFVRQFVDGTSGDFMT